METPPPFGLDAALRERLGERLGQFLRDCDGAYGVALSTLDGNPLVHRLDRDTLHGGKLAAMTSSLLGVGESIAREVEQRDCQFVILENSDGRLVSLRVDKYTMLTCITDAESPLGTVLNSGRSLAGTLARLLREPPPASPEA
ncbi:MAG: roadblock/LC7 domain-containing protein [Candidatus Competibacterales bacterium]